MNAPVARVSGSLRKRAKARAKALRMPLMPSLQQRRLQCHLAFMLGDILAIFAGFLIAGYMHSGLLAKPAMVLPQLVLPVYLTIALYNDSYSIDSLRSTSHSVTRSLLALGLSAAVVTFITFYARSAEIYSRTLFTFGVTLSALLCCATVWRCGVLCAGAAGFRSSTNW